MIINIFNNLLKIAWTLLKWPLYVLGALIFIYYIDCLGWTIYYRVFKKVKSIPNKGLHYNVKEDHIIKKLLWNTPKQYVLDRLTRDPGFFRPQGCILYVGRQGSGKTSTMIHDTRKMQIEYPKVKCIGNLGYKYQDDELTDWTQLIDYKNDIYGVIVQIDELQNWFNSKQSKNFPPEMLQIVTTNRKNRRVIMGTAQQVYMVAKDIRTQVTEIRHCYTFFGVLTLVIRKEPKVNSEGEIEEEKLRGWYVWTHDKEVREAYDTYRMIDVLRQQGFKDESEQYRGFEKQDKVVIQQTKK